MCVVCVVCLVCLVCVVCVVSCVWVQRIPGLIQGKLWINKRGSSGVHWRGRAHACTHARMYTDTWVPRSAESKLCGTDRQASFHHQRVPPGLQRCHRIQMPLRRHDHQAAGSSVRGQQCRLSPPGLQQRSQATAQAPLFCAGLLGRAARFVPR